jgi:hypothetical protein
MPITKEGYQQRGRRLSTSSGDTRFFVVPANRIAYLTEMEWDTSGQSGLFGVITIDVRDSYLAIDGASTTVVRKSIAVKAGDIGSIILDGEYQLLGGVDVRTNFGGPIISISAAFR